MNKKKMLSAYTIVFIFLLITAVLTWIVPQSIVVTNENGIQEVIYNAIFDSNGEIIRGVGAQPAGLWDIIMAPITGFQNAGPVSIAILMAGAFLGLINSVGALDAGIGGLLKRYTGTSLIAILMFVFAIFGSVFGFWEEIPAFSIVIVPLFVLAGYDVMTGLVVLFIGATAGNMASVVNPFSVGAAIGAIGNPELSLGSGMILRMVIFLALYLVGVVYVIKYANTVKKDKEKSIVAGIEVNTRVNEEGHELPELTKKRFWSIMVLVGIIILLILGYMPWYVIELDGGRTFQDVINTPINFIASIPILGSLSGFKHFTPFGDWYFGEFAFVFLLGSILIGLINRMPEEQWC